MIWLYPSSHQLESSYEKGKEFPAGTTRPVEGEEIVPANVDSAQERSATVV